MRDKAKAVLLKAEKAYNKVGAAYIKAREDSRRVANFLADTKAAEDKAEAAYNEASSIWHKAVEDYEKARQNRLSGETEK